MILLVTTKNCEVLIKIDPSQWKLGTKEQREQLRKASEGRMKQRKEVGDNLHESFDVTVPEGYEPGDKLRVEHKGRHILVVIPTGVYPGETFEVRLRKGPQMFKETIQHAGWLDKYPRNSNAGPKPKWFVLTAKALYYMEGEGMPPKQTWDLQGANVVKVGKSKLKFNNPFKDVELMLGCGAEDNQGAWMNRLQLCINMASEVKTADIEKDKDGKVNLLNKQLHGRPMKSGFLKKYATAKGAYRCTCICAISCLDVCHVTVALPKSWLWGLCVCPCALKCQVVLIHLLLLMSFMPSIRIPHVARSLFSRFGWFAFAFAVAAVFAIATLR